MHLDKGSNKISIKEYIISNKQDKEGMQMHIITLGIWLEKAQVKGFSLGELITFKKYHYFHVKSNLLQK